LTRAPRSRNRDARPRRPTLSPDPSADLGCFIPGQRFTLTGATGGPLAGVTFAAKDLYDVAGRPTTGGNPDWGRTHPVPTRHAPAVAALLDAGATLIGKTITDELAYGMTGRNFHFGTPVNGGASDRIPGGSSSGSGSAVSNGLCDTALGSDTGGSVRIPASYCGLYGMRPSHGRISLEGCIALAPSFDTCGWFARNPAVLERVGRVLLGDATPGSPGRLLRAADAFALADPEIVDALRPLAMRVVARLGAAASVTVLDGAPRALMETFRTLSAREAWEADGAWIEATKPAFGPDVQQRFDYARTVTDAAVAAAKTAREACASRLDALLTGGAVLMLPSAPTPAPRRDADFDALQGARERNLQLTCIAGLARLPQITIPGASVDGAPVGLSLIAARGQDNALLRLAVEIAG